MMSAEVASLPSWKLELIERKRRQETSVERMRDNDHTVGGKLDLSGIPGWKRDVLLRKQQQKGSVPGINGLNGVNKNLNRLSMPAEKSVEHEYEYTNLPTSNTSTALSDHLTEEERLLPITKNPILLLDLEKRHQGVSTGLDIEIARNEGPHSDRRSLSPNFTNNNSSNNCSLNPTTREDTEEVFQGEEGNLKYGKGFVHRLLKRFSGLTGKEENVKCNGLVAIKSPRRSRSSGDMMHSYDENGEMMKSCEEVTKSYDDLLQEAPISPNLISDSSKHYGSVPNGLSNLSFSLSADGRGDLDVDIEGEDEKPQENMVSNVRIMFEKFVTHPQPPGLHKMTSGQQIKATSNNKIAASSVGSAKTGNASAALPSVSDVQLNAQLERNVDPSDYISVRNGSNNMSDGKSFSVYNTQNKASSHSNITADIKTSSVTKTYVKEANHKIETTSRVAENPVSKSRKIVVNSTSAAPLNPIMNNSVQDQIGVVPENKVKSVNDSKAESVFAQQNKSGESDATKKQTVNATEKSVNSKIVTPASTVVSNSIEAKVMSSVSERAHDVSKTSNGVVVKQTSNIEKPNNNTRLTSQLPATVQPTTSSIKSAMPRINQNSINEQSTIDSSKSTVPMVNQLSTNSQPTIDNSNAAKPNNSQNSTSQPTFASSRSTTVASNEDTSKSFESGNEDNTKRLGPSNEDATKRPGPSRPGKLLIRPASNLLGSNTKSEFLGLTKYNDVKKGEFAPPTARPLPPVGSELDEDEDGVDGGHNYVFIGGEVRLGRSLLVKTIQYSKLTLHFDDNAELFEYPSEQSLMDSMPAQPGDCDYMTSNGSNNNSEDNSGEDPEFSSSILKPVPGLAGSTGSLSSYQSRTQINYQFGMYDSMEELSQQRSAVKPVEPEPKVESPPTTSYSGAGSSDLLF